MDSMPPFQTPGFLVNLGGVLLCLTVSSFEALAVSQDLGSKGAAFLGLPKLCRDRLGQ